MEYDLGETYIQDKYGVPIISIHETDGIIYNRFSLWLFI